MSDQFSRYEADLVDLIKNSKIKLADKIPLAEREEKKTLIRQVTKEVNDMSSIIGDMEFELNKFGPNSRSAVINKIKQFKLDIEIIQKDLKKASLETSKYKNYESINSNPYEANDPERRKVLQIHSSLMNAGESLARSTQIAIETEQIGNSVLTELNSQGEQLRRTTERLDDTSVALSKSRKLLNKLSNGIFYNKFLLVIIIVLELISLAGVIYWKFIAKK